MTILKASKLRKLLECLEDDADIIVEETDGFLYLEYLGAELKYEDGECKLVIRVKELQ